ncbi:hypothetical protein BXZ70DRAFT_907765 [Cristinia sonorae]|uniref:DUF6533 domain-containing protein n=1 Tax=Cristinia sonorae TaxID=1940300 RepID=A0A8K0UP58_9AGAR|nr:hypothetical protein BXZ70DRAFT_907765 [Cristinia sonorae]
MSISVRFILSTPDTYPPGRAVFVCLNQAGTSRAEAEHLVVGDVNAELAGIQVFWRDNYEFTASRPTRESSATCTRLREIHEHYWFWWDLDTIAQETGRLEKFMSNKQYGCGRVNLPIARSIRPLSAVRMVLMEVFPSVDGQHSDVIVSAGILNEPPNMDVDYLHANIVAVKRSGFLPPCRHKAPSQIPQTHSSTFATRALPDRRDVPSTYDELPGPPFLLLVAICKYFATRGRFSLEETDPVAVEGLLKDKWEATECGDGTMDGLCIPEDEDELYALWADIISLLILDCMFGVVTVRQLIIAPSLVAALVLYDYFLTLSKERTYVWGSKSSLSAGTLIYLVNRYVMLAEVLVVLSQLRLETNESCRAATWVSIALMLILQLSHASCDLPDTMDAVFAALRIYSIWGGNVKVGLATLLVHCIPLGFRIFTLAQPWEISSTRLLTYGLIPGCILSQETSFAFDVKTTVTVGNAFSIFAYGWTLCLTVWKTYTMSREMRAAKFSVAVGSMSSMLLRDGSVQFLVLTALTIFETVWILTHGSDASMYALVNALSSVLISNFVLNLRRVHLPDRSAPSSSVVFASLSTFSMNFVGNLGAPLGDDPEDAEIVRSTNPLSVGLDLVADSEREAVHLLEEDRDDEVCQSPHEDVGMDESIELKRRPSETQLLPPEGTYATLRWPQSEDAGSSGH